MHGVQKPQTGSVRKSIRVGTMKIKITNKMKIKSLAALTFFVGVLVLTSCSKETKIERNLWKKGGEWNIEKYDYSSTSTNGSNNISINLKDCGNVTFNKDGSGEFTASFFGTTETDAMTYTNTEDQLTLTVDGSTTTYDMSWEKDNITLTNQESSTDSGGNTTTETESYILKKK